jgi:hypothetical protein
MKTCSQCNETKELDLFGKDSRRLDGKRSNCKACVNKSDVKRRDKDREAYNAYQRQFKADPYVAAYSSQRCAAKQRGIPFLFGFDQWVSWWGEDFERRGRGLDDLVMARIGDEGPYCWHNVKKITGNENRLEAQRCYTTSQDY